MLSVLKKRYLRDYDAAAARVLELERILREVPTAQVEQILRKLRHEDGLPP
jgi:hypothetical protein